MGSFKYKPRATEGVVNRSKQQGSIYDISTKEGLPAWTPKAGDHSVRILPPTYDNAQHWGIDVWMHSNVGPDNQSYLCLAKMKNEPCPVCEEVDKAKHSGEDKRAGDLKAYRRVLMWVIVRSEEKDGPKLWMSPWTVDKDICACCVDKKTNEVLAIDDPQQGFDVDFTREGAKQQTKYVGIKIARRSTTLADKQVDQDKWLDFVVANPLPTCLNFYDYNHIMASFSGLAKGAKVDEEKKSEERKEDRVMTRNEQPPFESTDKAPTPRVTTNTDIDAPKPTAAPPTASSTPPGGGLRARIRAGLGTPTT